MGTWLSQSMQIFEIFKHQYQSEPYNVSNIDVPQKQCKGMLLFKHLYLGGSLRSMPDLQAWALNCNISSQRANTNWARNRVCEMELDAKEIFVHIFQFNLQFLKGMW